LGINGNSIKGVLEGQQVTGRRQQPGKRGFRMAKNEEETIDELARQVEVNLEIDYEKKDLKAQRGIVKQSLYDGSKKLKHTVPKGKRI
jgi:hypothetical protein